jgi:HemY protein
MLRSFWFLTKLILVATFAVWLSQHPGNAHIEFQNYVIDTSVGILLLAFFSVLAVTLYIYGLYRGLVELPGQLQNKWMQFRQRRGLEALTRGLVSVAAGDAPAALIEARRADRWLKQVPLKNLLAAQAAQLNGDHEAAAKYFHALMSEEQTSFLGVRGLLMQAMQNKQYDAALRLVNHAQELMPQSSWVARTSFDLAARQQNWPRANAALDHIKKLGALPREQARMFEASLSCERGREAFRAMDYESAYQLYKRAYHLDHDYLPAIIGYAQTLSKLQKNFRLRRVIDRAWAHEPHPAIGYIVWQEKAGDDLWARVKRCEHLQKINPKHPETHLLMAEAAISARLWGKARGHLEEAVRNHPTQRTFRLLTKLMASDNDNMPKDPLERAKREREFNFKAMQADPDPAWVCDDCQAILQDWQATCPSCGAFAAIEWRQPARLAIGGGKALNSLS